VPEALKKVLTFCEIFLPLTKPFGIHAAGDQSGGLGNDPAMPTHS
jgi:hypothetical protein